MSAPQPAQQFIVEALLEENRALLDNKLYLVAVIKQQQAEFAEARELWELERASLKAEAGD